MAAAQRDLAAMLRTRIRTLMVDPGVADRVRRRLQHVRTRLPLEPPSCFSPASGAFGPGSLAVSGDMTCHDVCGSVDCLCGRYPRWLSGKEVKNGPKLEQFAL